MKKIMKEILFCVSINFSFKNFFQEMIGFLFHN